MAQRIPNVEAPNGFRTKRQMKRQMMKQSGNKSTRSERKRLTLQRDTIRALSSELPRVVGGKTVGDGDNTACTANETGCMATNSACPDEFCTA
jgi:hypothetical protein